MKLETLKDLYLEKLSEILCAKQQLVASFPDFAEGATSVHLRALLQEQTKIMRLQVQRIEAIFLTNGEKPLPGKCEVVDVLIHETREFLKRDSRAAVRDAGVILAVQKIHHFQMAIHGALRTFARELGNNETADMLQWTLNEEKEADEKLTELAEASINVKAE